MRTLRKYLSLLPAVELFKGLEPGEIEPMLACLGVATKRVRKGETALLAGDRPRHVGITLAGQLHIIREDYQGNRSLMAATEPGDLFAEALCCAGVPASPVTVLAKADSVIALLSFTRLLHTCPNSCSFHTKMIGNMLSLIANKNLQMQNRMEIISLKSIRAKVLRHLESFRPGPNRRITIPFNREEWADFLRVERSALSHELAKMKKDGLIEYKKNEFVLEGAP